MHEHHEQEMTPSALSYQLRDTILAGFVWADFAAG